MNQDYLWDENSHCMFINHQTMRTSLIIKLKMKKQKKWWITTVSISSPNNETDH